MWAEFVGSLLTTQHINFSNSSLTCIEGLLENRPVLEGEVVSFLKTFAFGKLEKHTFFM